MRLFTVSASLSSLAALVQGQAESCLSNADAYSIIDRSAIYLSHPNVTLANTTAQGLFADNVKEFGDSINSLRGAPLGTEVEYNKTTYIADTLSTPPLNVTTLAVVHDCTRVVWHWQFEGVGSGEYRVRGFTLLHVDTTTGLVVREAVEFNSLAWAIDIGFNVIAPSSFDKRR